MRILTVKIIISLCGLLYADYSIPSNGLQLWLKADSIDSQTDLFLPTMTNLSNTRYSASQPQIQYRPLYIRNFVQNRPAVSLTDSRSFSFRALKLREQAQIYIGIYHQYLGEDEEFRILTFSYQEAMSNTEKDGFVLGIYDGTLNLHGVPGYSGAFTEFIMYDRAVSAQDDRKIRSYLKARYYINTDNRYVRNNIQILTTGVKSLSNVIELEDQTLAAAALVKDTHRRVPRTTLELVRSYNRGQRWTQSIGQILRDEEVSNDFQPFIYINKNGRIFCFYADKQPDSNFKLAYKYSDDEGFVWSEKSFVEGIGSPQSFEINSMADLGEETVFSLSGKSLPAKLIAVKNIDSSESEEIQWDIRKQIAEKIKSVSGSQTSNSTIAYGNGKLVCLFNGSNGFLYQMFSDDGGRSWQQPHKAKTQNQSPLHNPANFKPFVFTAGDELMMLFRNTTEAVDKSKDSIWLARAKWQGGSLDWTLPQVCFYAREFGADASAYISSAGIVEDDLYAAVSLAGGAYFVHIDYNSVSSPVPAGTGVFNITERTEQSETYTIPPLPSLLNGGFIIEAQFKEDILEEDALIAQIADENGKVEIFTKQRSFGISVTDGFETASFISCQYPENKAKNVVFTLNGQTDIIRITVNGEGQRCDDDFVNWKYFPAKIVMANNGQQIFIPENSYGKIKTMRLHYDGKVN